MYHETVTPEWHPFGSQIWLGTCDAGQLTREGLEDAVKHGQVRSLISLTCDRHLHGLITGLLVCLSRRAWVLAYGESSGYLRSNLHRSPYAPGRGCDLVWYGPEHD